VDLPGSARTCSRTSSVGRGVAAPASVKVHLGTRPSRRRDVRQPLPLVVDARARTGGAGVSGCRGRRGPNMVCAGCASRSSKARLDAAADRLPRALLLAAIAFEAISMTYLLVQSRHLPSLLPGREAGSTSRRVGWGVCVCAADRA